MFLMDVGAFAVTTVATSVSVVLGVCAIFGAPPSRRSFFVSPSSSYLHNSADTVLTC